mgnify:CR=1 FL=1
MQGSNKKTQNFSDDIRKKHGYLQEKYSELLWRPKDLWLISIRRRRRKMNKKDLKSSKICRAVMRLFHTNGTLIPFLAVRSALARNRTSKTRR